MARGDDWVLAFAPDAPDRPWWAHLAWVLAGMLVGFLVPALFSATLRLERSLYLVAYVLAVGGFLMAYARWAGVDPWASLRLRWRWGAVVGVAAAGFSIRTVTMQPPSPAPQGMELVASLAWLGVIYGLLDALFLTVFPMGAVWRGLTQHGAGGSWPARVAAGAAAVAASLATIAAYHVGYLEFRGPQVGIVVVGVGIQSLLTLLAGSPIVVLVSHVAMHVAAVLYGPGSVIQLPPHS